MTKSIREFLSQAVVIESLLSAPVLAGPEVVDAGFEGIWIRPDKHTRLII
jgi:hypothetical protein